VDSSYLFGGGDVDLLLAHQWRGAPRARVATKHTVVDSVGHHLRQPRMQGVDVILAQPLSLKSRKHAFTGDGRSADSGMPPNSSMIW